MDVVQLVERRIVIPVVAGSSPVIHPNSHDGYVDLKALGKTLSLALSIRVGLVSCFRKAITAWFLVEKVWVISVKNQQVKVRFFATHSEN